MRSNLLAHFFFEDLSHTITMRKTFRILSYIGLAIATLILALIFAHGIPVDPQGAAIALEKPFNDFPEGEPQFVDFRLDELSFKELTEREKQDQLRDWLLFTVASDHSLNVKEVNQSLYDLSTTRHGYMGGISNFEYGTTRSLYVGNGEVVALIPTNLEAGKRIDALAQITDKHRKDLGEKPSSILVFEYELDPEQQYGLITRKEVIDANTLFTPEIGYVEATVTNLANFQKFMDQINDLTYAQQSGQDLILGGRKLQGTAYQGIQVEDVAAIWQSEDKIRRDWVNFETKWNTKLNQASPLDQKNIEEQAYQEIAESGLVNGSGFSLDPAYDYRTFEQIFDEILPGLRSYISNKNVPITEDDIQKAKTGLNNDNEVPYLILVDKLKTSEQQKAQEIGAILSVFGEAHRLQKARYDGDLKGTEVGMVLFYTDLLAKLWALNYENSTPQTEIPDFASIPAISSKVASIYKQEIEALPNTRLWFGPQDKGFQASDLDNSLLFARNATRVYAASSNPLNPGEETFAAADSNAFLGWWNNHYEEIAAYEPQYEQLNEIMKWSLLITWLHDAEQADRLSFLANVSVHRDFWFPDWAKAKGDRLRFKDWQSVEFYPKGHLGLDTEVMPILSSESYKFFEHDNVYIAGGISLADDALFQSRKALSKIDTLDDLALRSNINYRSLDAVDDQIRFTTLDETAYRIFNEQPKLASVAVKAKEGSKLRGPTSELANLEFIRNVSRTDDGLNVITSMGKTELGRLQTARTSNGFKVGWLGRDMDNGQILVQQLRQSGNQLDDFLQNNPMVAKAATLSDDGSYLVKLDGADDWMQMANGNGGQNLPPDWHARIGHLADDAGIADDFILRWVDDELVQKKLTNGAAKLITNKTTDWTPALVPDELIVSLKQRNYAKVAAQIADDPQQIYATTRNHIQAELKHIDVLQANQPARALQKLDELIDIYGKQPDLMIKKALLDIKRQRISVQRIDPKGVITDPVAGEADFFTAVTRRFKQSGSNNRFRAIETSDELIYVQDSPRFNNIDPSTPLDDVFPFGSEARTYKVIKGRISDAHIGQIGYEDPIRQILSDSADDVAGSADDAANSFKLEDFLPDVPSGGGDNECEPQEGQQLNQCTHAVYVVLDDKAV